MGFQLNPNYDINNGYIDISADKKEIMKMATQILMPKYGHTMTKGEIVEWLVAPGDQVKVGDSLCEVTSEKITNLLESPVDGVVKALLFEEGDEVEVGVPIIEIA